MSDDTYIHEPESASAPAGHTDPSTGPDARSDGLGPRGWLLVGLVLFCFVVAPLLIWLNPPQLPFVVAYLVLPLIPAFVLGLVAVWVTASA